MKSQFIFLPATALALTMLISACASSGASEFDAQARRDQVVEVFEDDLNRSTSEFESALRGAIPHPDQDPSSPLAADVVRIRSSIDATESALERLRGATNRDEARARELVELLGSLRRQVSEFRSATLAQRSITG